MPIPPIIYNLFPLLAGPFSHWPAHLERASHLGFNWLYFNPVSYPGFSGSLYSVKEHYRFHPRLTCGDQQGDERVFADVLERMASLGLSPMMDLVINHTAIDSPLIKTHRDWYQHDAKRRIVHPGAQHNGKKITWGDLASIDNAHSADRDALWAYWDELIAHHQSLGVKGFRCDAAYKVPVELWQQLIGTARARDPQARFFAETLGCEIDDVIALAHAGFDFTFNSGKWWDFKADWCLDQYRQSHQVCASIGFPESHDTPRLAAELHGDLGAMLGRYAFAAWFSSGVMMPMGFEFGATQQLHVVNTCPEDLDRPTDLSDAIRAINDTKRQHPALCGEGAIQRIDPEAEQATALEKSGPDGSTVLMTIAHGLSCPAPNPPAAWAGAQELTPAPLWQAGHPVRLFSR